MITILSGGTGARASNTSMARRLWLVAAG